VCWLITPVIFRQPSILRNLICPLATGLKSRISAASSLGNEPCLGGHAVPERPIRRRYRSGWRNFFALYRPLTTTWRMYDNSTHELRLLASGTGTETRVVNDPGLWERIGAEAEDEGQAGKSSG
jgi:hypothetical protein